MHYRKMGAAPTAMPMPVASAPDFVFDRRTLRFDLNEAALKPGAGETLSAVVDFLNDYPEISVRIADHRSTRVRTRAKFSRPASLAVASGREA